MNWTTKTKNESAIESNGFFNRVKPILDVIMNDYTVFEPDTVEQKNLKVDGMGTSKHGKEFYFENKIVNGNYERIFAEYMAVPNNAPPRAGWMTIDSRVNKPTVLIYAMINTVYLYNLDNLKAWYKTADKSVWQESKVRDYVFSQDMYGHLIPIKEIEQFLIYKFKV